MASKAVLNLSLQLQEGREVECAKAMFANLRSDEWRVLRQLAAEVTALGESMAAGVRMLVVPAAEVEAEVAEALRLRVAGRE